MGLLGAFLQIDVLLARRGDKVLKNSREEIERIMHKLGSEYFSRHLARRYQLDHFGNKKAHKFNDSKNSSKSLFVRFVRL